MDGRVVGASALLGLMTGLRSTAGVAVVATRLFPRRRSTRALEAALLGEMIADKLPFIPPRTEPLPFLGRVALAAAAGAGAARLLDTSPAVAATAAAMTAGGAAIGATHARRVVVDRGVPDLAQGLLEDAAVLAAGAVVLQLLDER